ncbi:MAG TPA: D-alanyl-D-alanine carboxypeptidase family protein [Caulobacteraceae bacterium]
MVTLARRVFAFLTLVIMASAVLVQPAAAQIPYVNLLFSQPRYAAYVMDANTGEVLYEKNADSPRYPASITKLMTLYLTFEALQAGKLSLSDRVYASVHSESVIPSKLGLRPGDSVSVDEAIRSMTVKSANDMAVAMAEKIAGSEGKFAALMTLRAQELGMTNTQYVNASGLPDTRQISTAHDIAVLSRALMRDFPQYYPYFSLRSFDYRGRVIPGHDHLLGAVPGVDGLKTGYTAASGFNLASSAVRDGKRIIGVVLGGSSVAARDQHMEDLINTSFNVIHRRSLGERITVAQNLYEPAPTGPILRPATEEGDGDQTGVKIIVNDESGVMRPVADPILSRPAVLHRAAEPCREVRTTHVERGRHGRRIRVSEVSRKCEGARLTEATDVRPCTPRHGRHHARCEATVEAEQVSNRHGGRGHHGNAGGVSGRHERHGHIGHTGHTGRHRRSRP